MLLAAGDQRRELRQLTVNVADRVDGLGVFMAGRPCGA